MELLVGCLGARIGREAITRQHPADSHIPEKAVATLAAAWSEPANEWTPPPVARPVLMWRPEPVTAEDCPDPPLTFRWRRRDFETTAATGPERIAPEWWLDEPDWRSGVRDYWRVTTASGERLWLYYAHGDTKSSGWFCQGAFA
jgi:protein ImuB